MISKFYKTKIPHYSQKWICGIFVIIVACKTFASCTFIEEDDISNITEEKSIEKIKELLIKQKVKYESTEELHDMAVKELSSLSFDQIYEIKKEF